MIPRHTASPLVELKAKQMGRLYVIVCLPVVFHGPGCLSQSRPFVVPVHLSICPDSPSLSTPVLL
jgi:hypothetical protein